MAEWIWKRRDSVGYSLGNSRVNPDEEKEGLGVEKDGEDRAAHKHSKIYSCSTKIETF